MKVEQRTEEQKLKSWNSLIVVLILLFVFNSCVNVDLYDKPRDVRFKELDAGKCYLLKRKVTKSRQSPTGFRNRSDNFRLLESSDTIKTELNTNIGIEFVLWARTKTMVPLKFVLTFPEPIVNEKGKKFEQVSFKRKQLTHERAWVAYSLGSENMLVKGKWKMEVYHKKNKLLEKIFYLI